MAAIFSVSPSIEPLIGGLILAHPRSLDIPIPIEPLIGGLIRPCGNEELEMRNEKWEMSNYLSQLNRGSRSAFNYSLLITNCSLFDFVLLNPLYGDWYRRPVSSRVSRMAAYWTPYRGIEMLICLPWKGSGGGVVYGCGVWRVKSWVKNVLNTNKYIAIFSIKWGWSPLTYLSLVVIISEKSIILFYWTPYRGIDTHM